MFSYELRVVRKCGRKRGVRIFYSVRCDLAVSHVLEIAYSSAHKQVHVWLAEFYFVRGDDLNVDNICVRNASSPVYP